MIIVDYSDIILNMDAEELELAYEKLTEAQQRVVDEIIARHELTDEEFDELIGDDTIYYTGKGETKHKGTAEDVKKHIEGEFDADEA